MSIRALTGKLLAEASEGRRRAVNEVEAPLPPVAPPPAPQLPFSRVVGERGASERSVSNTNPEPKKHPIPGGIAARFAVRRTESPLERSRAVQTEPPEAPRRPADAASDDDTAPITIELQSH